MADRTKIEAEVEVDGSQAVSETAAVSKRITHLISELGKLEQKFKTAFDSKALAGATTGIAAITKDLHAASQALGQVRNLTGKKLGAFSGGATPARNGDLLIGNQTMREAITRRQIQAIESTTEQMVARVAEATIRAHGRGLKSTDQMMAAQIKKQIEQRDKMLRETTQAAMAASTRRHQQMLREMKVMYSPTQVAASGRLFDFRMGERLLDSDPTVLAARGNRNRVSRAQMRNMYSDEGYVSSLMQNNALNQTVDKKIAQDLTYQYARVTKKERDYLRKREELLDDQLQNLREERSLHSARRLRTTQGDAAWVRGRDTQNEFNDARTRRRGQIGVFGEANENTLNRLTDDGGAGIMAIQTRIMTGYLALSGAISMARNLSTFIVELDREFRNFQAITNTTAGEMVKVKQELIAVSEATRFTALEVAQAATVLGQAGMSAQNVRDSIEAITLLATAAGTDLNDAVDAVTSTLSIFNLQADQATQIANTFTAALNGSKLSMDKITLGLQYAGNTAAQFGVTYQELTAMMGAMANSGIRSGSTLGTGMRMLLVSLTEPTKKFREELAGVGLTTADVDVKAKGLVGVLQTLKDAGFGASEAYRSFEVRAASAYAAMSNNLDLGIALEENFIGSNAAMAANETQMQALANQYDRLQSSIGTLAYTAMEPFLNLLTDGIRLAADFASALKGLAGVLPVIAVGLAGLGTAVGIRTFGALMRGGARGLGLTGIREQIEEIGPAATRAGRAIQFLSVGLGSFGLWASALVSAGTAFYAFVDTTSKLEKQIMATEALASRSKQNLDGLQQTASSVEQTISNLRAREAELGDDPLARRLKIEEVIAQFSELGTKINSTTSSVGDLITALEGIREVNFGQQLDELRNMIETNKLLAQQIERNRQENSDRGDFAHARANLTSMLMTQVDNETLGGLQRGGAGRNAVMNLGYLEMQERFKKSGIFNADTDNAMDLVMNPITRGQDLGTNWGGLLTRLETQQTRLQQQSDGLSFEMDSVGRGNDGYADLEAKAKDVKQLLDFISALVAAVRPQVTDIEEIKRRNRENDQAAIKERQVQRDQVITSSNLRRQAQSNAEDLGNLTGGYNQYFGEDFVGASDRLSMAETLRSYLDDIAVSWGEAEAQLIADLAGIGITDEGEVKQAISEAKLVYTQQVLAAENLIDANSKEAKKALKDVRDAQKSVAETALQQATANYKSANSEQAMRAAAEIVQQKQEEVWAIEDAVAQAAIDEAEDPQVKTTMKAALTAQQGARVRERQQWVLELNKRLRDLEKDVLNTQKTTAQRGYDQAVARLEGATSPEQVRAAAAHVQAKQAQLWAIEDKITQMALDEIDDPVVRDATIAQNRADRAAREDTTAEFVAGVRDRLNDFQQAAIQAQLDSVKAQLEEVQRQIDEETRKINELGAGADFTGLHNSLQTLFATARALLGQQTQLEGQLTTLGGDGSGSGYATLAQLESRGRFEARGGSNNHYVGRMQFGQARLNDFSKAMGIGPIDRETFRQNPELQIEVERWHFNDILTKIRSGQAGQVGKVVNGVVMDEGAMMAVAHKQGFGGLQTYMKTGYDQKDGFGTANTKYAAALSGKDVSNYDAYVAATQGQATSAAQAIDANLQAQKDLARDVQLKEAEVRLDESEQQIRQLVSRARAANSPEVITGLVADMTKALDERDARELAKFDVENPNSPLERDQLIRQLADDRNQQIASILGERFDRENDAVEDVVNEAQARLDMMNRPENKGRFTDADRNAAEKAVRDAEMTQKTYQLVQLEGQIAAFKAQQAAAAEKYGNDSAATLYWAERIAEVERERAKVAKDLKLSGATPEAETRSPFDKAFSNWKSGSGNLNADGTPVDMAVQTEQAWDQVLTGLESGFGDFFMNVTSGFDSLGDSVKSLGLEVVQMLQQMLSKALAFKTMLALGSKIPFLGDVMKYMTPNFGMAATGVIGVPGRDSVPYLLEPGEAVLRRSAVSVVGEDNLKNLNNLGNRVQNPTISWEPNAKQEQGVVNVWVVTPDQQPPLTEKDIIAVISNDIMNRGPVKKMIKSVQMGEV